MDRHICGACNAEINDIDDFIVHKKQTCPALQQTNSKKDAGLLKDSETESSEIIREDLINQHPISEDVLPSRSHAAESSKRLPETIFRYQSALQNEILQPEHTINTNESLQNGCKSINQINVDEAHSNSSVLALNNSAEFKNTKATTQKTMGMQSLSKHSTLVSTSQNKADHMLEAAVEQCPEPDTYFSELDARLVSRTHSKSTFDKSQVSLVTIVTDGQTETTLAESCYPLVMNAPSDTSAGESYVVSGSCVQSDTIGAEPITPLYSSVPMNTTGIKSNVSLNSSEQSDTTATDSHVSSSSSVKSDTTASESCVSFVRSSQSYTTAANSFVPSVSSAQSDTAVSESHMPLASNLQSNDNNIGLYGGCIGSEVITADSHITLINNMNLSTASCVSSVVYTPPPGHEYIQTTGIPKYTEESIEVGERHNKINDQQNSNELTEESTKESVIVSSVLSNVFLPETSISETPDVPLVVASVKSPIMSTGVSTVVSAEVTGEMSSANIKDASNERSSESQLSGMVQGMTCQDLQMVLDHNGTYSLIPSAHIPLFLHQSDNNENQPLVLGNQIETMQTREVGPSTTAIKDAAWHQNRGVPNIPSKQMKSIIPANLQKLKQIISSSDQRDQAVSFLANKTNPMQLQYVNLDKTTLGATLGQQLNQNSQQKVIMSSSIGTKFTTNQHDILEFNKRSISTKPHSDNQTSQIMVSEQTHSDNQTSQIMLSEQTVLTQSDLEIAKKLSVIQQQNVLKSSKHASINSELSARTRSLSSENIILTGSQNHLPVCIRPGLSSTGSEQEPVKLSNFTESEHSNLAASLQQNSVQNLMLDQNRSLQRQLEIKAIDKQVYERMGKTSNKIQEESKTTSKTELLAYKKYIHTASPAQNNSREETLKHGVSLVKQNFVEKLKEAQIHKKINDNSMLVRSARSHLETIGTGRCATFEKSIAIQTDPVSVDQNVNNENILSYVTGQKTGSYDLQHNDIFHDDENAQNISNEQEQDIDHENSNDQLLIEPVNLQKTNRPREQVQNPVSEFLLAQDSLNATSSDFSNRNAAENVDIAAMSSSVRNQEKDGSTEQVVHNSSVTGIQYIVEETPQGNCYVPISTDKGMDITQPQITKQTKRQITPTAYKGATLQETFPEDNHYSVHLQSIDVSKTIDRQIIQIVGTPEGYYDASSQKKTPGSGSSNKKKLNKPVKDRIKKYTCTFDKNCSFSSVYHKDLKRHIRTHTGEKPFCCGMCEKRFSRLDKLRLHIRAHTGERPFQCDVCEYRAVDASTLKKHAIIHTDQKPHICQLCNYKCRTSSQLTVHLRTHTGDRPFPCPSCPSKFMIKSDLRRHVRTHTGEKPFQCNKCDVKCTTQGNLHSHIKIHHSEERQLKCTDCDYKTSSKRGMRDHDRSHESINTDNICQICYFKCVNLESLKRHVEMHKKDYYTCSHCDFFTRHTASLEGHIKRKHSEHFYENKTKRTKSTSGSNKKSKGDNNKKHSKNDKLVYSVFQRLYACDRCNESFVRKDSLKSHLRLHEELSNNNLKLSTAMTVLKLRKPVINQARYQENEVEKEQHKHTVFDGHSETVQMVSSEEEQTPKRHFYGYEGEADYEQQTPDSDVSQGHHRQHENQDIQTDSVSSQHHRRQLDFDDSVSKYHTSSNKRRSLEISSVSNSSKSHDRLSLKNVYAEHSSNKRSRSLSENIGISQRPVCDFSKSQQELLRLDTSERAGVSKIVKHKESPQQMYIYNKKNKSEMSRSKTVSSSRTMTSHEADIKNQFSEHDGRNTVITANEQSRQTQPPLPPQPQPIFQVPNIQLVQNISLPIVRLPDGQILSAYGGSQILPEINVEQLRRPGNENVQTIQVVAPPNVGVLSPNSNHLETGPNIPMPQVIELVDSLGNPISAQFMVQSSVGPSAEIATLQTVNITGMQEQGGVMEQMLSPQHVMTVPLHVLDMQQNK